MTTPAPAPANSTTVAPQQVAPQQVVIKNPVKTGIATTEFWKNAAFQVVALLTVVGQINPTGNPKYDQWIRVAAIVSAALSNIGYFKSRADTKSASIQAVAELAHNITYNV